MTKRLLIALSLILGWQLPARAEHANIDLRLMRMNPDTGVVKDETTATSDQEPPTGGVKARPLLKVKAKDSLMLQFVLTNTYPHGIHKDVTVRYFVTRVEKIGQKTLPEPGAKAVVRGQFKMNFRPKCQVGARAAFTAPEPGIYLLRVDTLNTASDHEHFSAIDLKVE
jgi:hypothetical protein